MPRWNQAVIATLLFTVTIAADRARIDESRRLVAEARQAYQAKDYPVFLEKVRAASDLRPTQPTLRYYLAAAQALAGKTDDAIESLEHIASMGMVYTPENEPDFAALAESPRFQRVVERFRCNARPQGTGRVAARLNQAGIIPEGLARDERRDVFFLSSVKNGDIWRITPRSASRLVEGYPLAIMGLAFDPKRNVIWAAAAGLPEREGLKPEDEGRGALIAVDGKSGKIVHELEVPGPDAHLIGDIAISPRGDVVATDSRSNEVYRIHNGLVTIFTSGPFVSLQGIAWSPDARSIYVADYSQGIFRIDEGTGDARLLATPPGQTLLGIDGIYFADERVLIAVQNGTNPNRILQLTFDRAGEIWSVVTESPKMPRMRAAETSPGVPGVMAKPSKNGGSAM